MTDQAATVAQHTAGPWRVQRLSNSAEFCIQDSAGEPIAWVDRITPVTEAREGANAHLIAAAPEMATALLWIREHLHPRMLGRGATDAELLAITHATMVLRQAGVIPTPELQEAQS